MATKKVTKKEATEASSEKAVSSVLIGPRVTEKAAYATEKDVYVFNVEMSANKIQVRQAIVSQYKVVPTKIAMVVSKPRATMFRGVPGKKSAFKKAYVYLKKGDTIEVN